MRNTHKSAFKRGAGVESSEGAYSKNKYIKPEHVGIGTTYSFSWNPETQPDDYQGPNEFKQWWDAQVEFFRELKYCKVRLFCEFSQHGRYHFHGTIKILSYMFYLKDVRRLNNNGACEMDTIGDHEVWLMYCFKNQLFMQQYIRSELAGPFLAYDPDKEFTVSS